MVFSSFIFSISKVDRDGWLHKEKKAKVSQSVDSSNHSTSGSSQTVAVTMRESCRVPESRGEAIGNRDSGEIQGRGRLES